MKCKYFKQTSESFDVCYGTKNCERCYCKGNTAMCTFYEHIRKGESTDCTSASSADITCNGERQKFTEQVTTGSVVNAEIGSKTIILTTQKEGQSMKDKRFVLNLHLEQNEELMMEIDNLLRERVKVIIREEAEKMLGGAIQEEAVRVAKQKLADMKNYDFRNAMITAMNHKLHWDTEMKGIVAAGVKDYMRDNSYSINCQIRDAVSNRLGISMNADAIKAVVDALTSR
jgi:hypothetical protein